MIRRVSKSISHIVAVPFFERLFLTARDFLHNLDGPTTESRDDEWSRDQTYGFGHWYSLLS